jgi:hypothetical protein
VRTSQQRHALWRGCAALSVLVAAACEDPTPEPPIHAERLTPRQIANTFADLTGRRSDELGALPAADETLQSGFSLVDAEVIAAAARATAEALVVEKARTAPCAEGEDARLCAGRVIDNFGWFAFRGPVPPESRAQLLGMFDKLYAEVGYDTALRAVFEAILQSPLVLYRVENPVPQEDGTVVVDDFAIASRLSYFLWDSMPDDALLDLAKGGKLQDPGVRVAQVSRMLDDPRAPITFVKRVRDWLELDLESLTKDPTIFPAYNVFSPMAMDAQVEFFVNMAGWGRTGSFHRLLTDPAGLASEPDRRGILMLPGVLASLATPTESSPVLRGKLIRERLFCETIASPPPGLDISIPAAGPSTTTRQRFEKHGLEEPCAACHTQLDPLGFAFEHYDATGAWRDEENSLPIDATGVAVHRASGATFEFDGARDLVEQLDASGVAARCWARHFTSLALGPGVDAAELRAIEDEFLGAETGTMALYRAIAASTAFVRPRAIQGAQ